MAESKIKAQKHFLEVTIPSITLASDGWAGLGGYRPNEVAIENFISVTVMNYGSITPVAGFNVGFSYIIGTPNQNITDLKLLWVWE